MRLFSKALLKVVTVVAPVFIAACYGMQARPGAMGPPQRLRAGHVIDQATRQPVAGATAVCDTKGEAVAAATTAADGSFTLDLACPGYTIEAQGYAPGHVAVTPDVDNPVIELAPAPTATEPTQP
jgi:hypothetical protein